MTKERFFELLNTLDEDLITRAEETAPKQQKKKILWMRWGAAAACLCLLLGAVIALPMMHQTRPPVDDPDYTQPSGDDSSDVPSYDPILFNAMTDPENISGSSLEFVVGSSASVSSSADSECWGRFTFMVGWIVVKARVIENLPDMYYTLDNSSTKKPPAYRMIKMETLEVIHGENIPQYFWYRIPEGHFADMSVYDSLLIAMPQVGTKNYVMRNGTLNRIEAFSLPVFGQSPFEYFEDIPANIIAFTDGLYDERLWWQKYCFYSSESGITISRKSTSYGFPKEAVRIRTEEDAVTAIQNLIQAAKEREGEQYKAPHPITLDFTSEEAKAALEYVKPFKNGVFSQILWPCNDEVTFRRYINGCQTEETIRIDLLTEEVTYSEIRYTEEDLSSLEDIAAHISMKAAEYAADFPIPPHIDDPEGKELASLHLYGWYVKADGKVYGIVKTGWKYRELIIPANPHGHDYDGYVEYYDEVYTLYDAASATAKNITREDLVEIVGWRNIYYEEFGKMIYLPYR